MPPIRIREVHRIVCGIRIPVKVIHAAFGKADRVVGKEPPDDRVVVAGLHVCQAGVGVADVAGEALTIAVLVGPLQELAIRGVGLAPMDVAIRERGRNIVFGVFLDLFPWLL